MLLSVLQQETGTSDSTGRLTYRRLYPAGVHRMENGHGLPSGAEYRDPGAGGISASYQLPQAAATQTLMQYGIHC